MEELEMANGFGQKKKEMINGWFLSSSLLEEKREAYSRCCLGQDDLNAIFIIPPVIAEIVPIERMKFLTNPCLSRL